MAEDKGPIAHESESSPQKTIMQAEGNLESINTETDTSAGPRSAKDDAQSESTGEQSVNSRNTQEHPGKD